MSGPESLLQDTPSPPGPLPHEDPGQAGAHSQGQPQPSAGPGLPRSQGLESHSWAGWLICGGLARRGLRDQPEGLREAGSGRRHAGRGQNMEPRLQRSD